MDLLAKHFDTLATLFFGAAFAITAILRFVRNRNLLEMVLLLSLGAALMTPPLLDLLGLLATEWVSVSRNALLGIVFMWTSISALFSPPSPSFPKWTQWAMLVSSVGFILAAIVEGLLYSWS